MGPLQTSVLVRSAIRFIATSSNSIVGNSLFYLRRPHFQPYVRSSTSQAFCSCRPNVRFYTTIPSDGIKVYTFSEIDFITKSQKDKYIIDVREVKELQQEGKIPTAINLPLSSLQESLALSDEIFEKKFNFKKPEKNKEVIFYCKAGIRSANASVIAKEAGYIRVGNYKGSFDDWIASKGTVVKGV